MAGLAVILGDPSGIGPEVVLKALASTPAGDVLVIGDRSTWSEAERVAGMELPSVAASRPEPASPRGVPFLNVAPEDRSWTTGEISVAAGRAAALWLERGVRLALERVVDAVVFAPLNKQALMRAGYDVKDEYELIARWCGVQRHMEMSTVPRPAGKGLLWVARVTTHVPFREIHAELTQERLLDTIRTAHDVVFSHVGARPRLAVAALNPHGGEGGLVGDEELRVIGPAIAAARAEGKDVRGPYPADRIFLLAGPEGLDAVVCLYHDQAQIATKLLGSNRAVTLGTGFPFVLATASHGTALDIAGRGVADPKGMIQALEIARRLADPS